MNPPLSVPLARRSVHFRLLAAICLAAVILENPAPCAFAQSTASLAVLHRFAKDANGAHPTAPLIQGRDGNFYGTTHDGGGPGGGTAFRLTPAGTLTTIHTFTSAEGSTSQGALLQAADGNFYGVLPYGGTASRGTFYQLTPDGVCTVLHNFTAAEGYEPTAGPILGQDGNFYGTTQQGGVNDKGIVYRITPGGAFTTLHAFNGTDGRFPAPALVQANDGNFYGVTVNGGPSSDYGTVYRLTPDGTFTTLHVFASTDGASPAGTLIQGLDGSLFGTTASGGNSGYFGTVYALNTDGSHFTTLYRFSGKDGEEPLGGVLQGRDGNLYGTTNMGGSTYGTTSAGSGYGAVYQLTPGGRLTVLHSFVGSDGEDPPNAALLQGTNGNFYGVTNSDSTFFGTIFSLTVSPVLLGGFNLPAAVGQPFRFPLVAANAPTSYSATGLPDGLTLDSSTGVISGTPSAAGTATVNLKATNPGGTGTATLTITVSSTRVPLPVVASAASANASVGTTFSYRMVATNGPNTYAATGLPVGLNVDSYTGMITGTPLQAGIFNATLSATNSAGTGTANLQLTIADNYATWQLANFVAAQLLNPAASGEMGDAAGNGVPNLLKYALGLPSKQAGLAGLPLVGLRPSGGASYLTLTYTHRLLAADAALAVDVSGDLSVWSSGPAATVEISRVANGDGTETVVTRDQISAEAAPRRFIRLRATR